MASETPRKRKLGGLRNIWSRNWSIASFFIVLATGLIILFFDKTDDENFYDSPEVDTTQSSQQDTLILDE
ncbi:MAG: hypothetical protein IIA45_13560 [Bacteroidetes bacterium]|nr:hypothetical protein [Bacteroidota bacterium]